jgi:hypothetical protein
MPDSAWQYGILFRAGRKKYGDKLRNLQLDLPSKSCLHGQPPGSLRSSISQAWSSTCQAIRRAA